MTTSTPWGWQGPRPWCQFMGQREMRKLISSPWQFECPQIWCWLHSVPPVSRQWRLNRLGLRYEMSTLLKWWHRIVRSGGDPLQHGHGAQRQPGLGPESKSDHTRGVYHHVRIMWSWPLVFRVRRSGPSMRWRPGGSLRSSEELRRRQQDNHEMWDWGVRLFYWK